jgi:hypothetical protein
MSKVNELRKKYPSINGNIFNRLVEGDITPTKKYLDYMLKTWECEGYLGFVKTSKNLINLIKKFDELLPYIKNKDIYSKEYYGNPKNLVSVVERAEELREVKTFKREEHAIVLLETENYLFVAPKTHRGSVKYGANTKWCTASKRDEATFKKYYGYGFLVYLIDKTEKIKDNFRKVAFFHPYIGGSLNDAIELYSSNDLSINENNMINAGWKEEDLFRIFTSFRHYFINLKKIKSAKKYVDNFVKSITNLDFSEFENSLKILDEKLETNYIHNVKSKI